MRVVAWNNGSYRSDGNGYGIKISQEDRDAFFIRSWGTILIELERELKLIEVNIDKESFWNDTCRELISVKIGKWMIKRNIAPWRKDKPPTLRLERITDRLFSLSQ